MVTGRGTLLHQRRKATNKIHAQSMRSPIQLYIIILTTCRRNKRNRGDGNTLMDNRNTEFPLNLLTHVY